MKLIEGITDQPKQQTTLPLDDGSSAVWSLTYRAQQGGWFFDIAWGGRSINGQRLVASPNVLRQFINVLPFGILVVTADNSDPTSIESFVDGSTSLVLLQGADINLVETTAYGAKVAQVQAVGTSNGQSVVIPPDQWGPAGGDLDGNFPNPSVIAIHEGSSLHQQLTIGAIADGQVLKRIGSSIVGTSLGSGDVVGPAGAADGATAIFDGTTGKLLRAGPNLSDGSGTLWVSIIKSARESKVLQTIGCAGAITLNLSSTNRMLLNILGPTNFASAGFANEFQLDLIVHNVSGVSCVLTWPGWSVASGALPTTILPGAAFSIHLELTGPTEPEVWATLISAPPNFGPGVYGGGLNTSTITVDNSGRISALGSAPIAGLLPPSVSYGDSTHSAQISTDALGRISSITSVPITGGGGGGGNVPAGGSAYQRLAKNSATNYDTGFYSGSIIDLSDYLANGDTFQNAFNAACAIGGCLQLPPGLTALPAGGLLVPSSFIGGVSIRGCGKNVSFLSAAAGSGMLLTPNAPTCQPGNTFFHLKGFSIRCDGADYGLKVDFGTGTITSQGGGGNCTFEDIHCFVGSANFGISAFYFRNLWQSTFRGLSALSSSVVGGDALTIDMCVNLQFVATQIQGFYRGLYVTSNHSEGLNFSNLRLVAQTYPIYATMGTNQGIWVDNFMCDNGNFAVTGQVPISLFGPGTGHGGWAFTNGQVLQFNGVDAMALDNCEGVMIQNVDFTYCANSTTAVRLKNGTLNCSIQACKPPLAGSPKLVVADAGTSGSKAYNNITGASFTDNGSNSLVS